MKEKSIHERLENWARFGAGGRYRMGHASSTAAICEYLKKAKMGLTGRLVEEEEIDEEDAKLVNDAWIIQLPKHKKLLQLFYVGRANPDMICRRLGIKIRPASAFDLELRRAQDAIQKTIDYRQERHKIPSNNLLPSI